MEQRGINIVLNVFAPDGSRLFFVDRQGQGTKEVVLVAVTTGAFRLWIGVQAPPQSQNIAPGKIAPGKYEVRIAELRSATAADQLRYDATKAYSELIAQRQRKEADAQQRTLHASEDALRLFAELQDYRAVLATRNFLMTYFQRLPDKPKALENLAAIQALLPQLNDTQAQANQLIGTGLSYRAFYEYQQALANYEQAYRLFESLADQDGMMRATNAMARVHTDTLNFRKTIELRTKALPYYRAKNDRNFAAYLLQEIGRAYRNLGEHDNAIAPLQESLELYQETGNQEGAYDSWFSLGVLYFVIARQAEALEAQYAGATDSIQKSFAALMLLIARGGWVFDHAPIRRMLGRELASIRDMARQTAPA